MTSSDDPAESTDVLVVGAGPVGLFAALCAAQRGLAVVLLDHVWRGYGRGHATLLHAASLALLDGAGVGNTLRDEAMRVDRIELVMNGRDCGAVELPSPAYAVSQMTLEKVLLAALREAHVEVRAPHQATTIEQCADHVEVRVVRRELVTLGSPGHYSEWEPVDSSVLSAGFVIGADGYDSRVRSAIGIESVEVAPPESFAMFEFASGSDAHHTGQLCFKGHLGGVMYPLPGGHTRWGFQINEGLDRPPDAGRLHELLADRAPAFVDGMHRVEWGTVIHFERRLARRFGKGRTWLAGDAAHVTSPLGNQSMNIGLHEAWDLTRRIADCHAGKSHSVLDHYAAERQREWHKLLGVNVSFELLPHAPPWLAAHARNLVPALPASGSDLEEMLEILGLRLS